MSDSDEFEYHLLKQSADEPVAYQKEPTSPSTHSRIFRFTKGRPRVHLVRKLFCLYSSWWMVLLLVASVVINVHLLISPQCIPNEITIKYVPTNASLTLDSSQSYENEEALTPDLSFILPKTISYNDSQILAMVEERSHMAAKYFDRWSNKEFGRDAVKHKGVTYCDRVQMVSPHLVHQNNFYWQVMDTSFGGTPMVVYLYNAYYDNRLWAKPAVRLITVTKRQAEVEKVSSLV